MDSSIEMKWMKYWEQNQSFEANSNQEHQKKFVTFPFPYMNGPLHIGHAFTSVRVDVFARFKRMQGYDVLFPWAWHWTGQPIVAAAERLAKGDKDMVREFVEIDGINPGELSKFYDPKFMASYYTDCGRIALKQLGLSIDWRREFHTTDLEPTFNKFVIWQYNKLREKGFVSRGTHPVVWCPRDQSPTGDHDRVQGEGVTWEEYTLVLFKMSGSDALLPAATFRPETIYGVTNLWINPDAKYVYVKMDDGQEWLVSKEAAAKLQEQLRKPSILREITGREIIGEFVTSPLDQSVLLPILPASFVDPKNGSGVVYSVPAHAPMDYVALRDLQSNENLQDEFNLDKKVVGEIRPISLITLPGMGAFPAKEIIEQMNVLNQTDQRVELATAEIYKREFHQGVLSSIAGKYEGKKVSEAKPMIIEELKKMRCSSSMYDLPEKVVCRCLTECIVKVLEDQWFLKYSDPGWKALAHRCVDSAEIYPESARQWFHDVVDWIKDWPCARKVGLGTPLAWSPGWIVETLSDSTIYMAFYTIRPLLLKLNIGADSLSDEFFDNVFLGEGSCEAVSSKSGIPIAILEQMRSEFLYWYPVDLRNSAKELIPNHLLFFIFQHTAFFPESLWPKGISANGMMTVEGEKMSKSKGNVITISNALRTYGADALRAGLIDGAEGMDDIDWREKNARDIQSRIESLPTFIESLKGSEISKIENLFDYWILNQNQKHIASITSNLDSMKTKTAFREAFYDYWNDLKRYVSMVDERPANLITEVIETWLKLLSPFIPYSVEEINERRGNVEMVSTSNFPTIDQSKAHPEAEIGITLLDNLVEDSKKILKLIKQPARTIHVYAAPEWQYKLFELALQSRKLGTKTSDVLQQFFSAYENVNKKEAASAMNKISRNMNELGQNFLDNYKKLGSMSEFDLYNNSSKYLAKQLGIGIVVHEAQETNAYDPKSKAKFSMAFKPALYVE